MNHTSQAITVFLLSYYGIINAHVVDIHLPNAEESALMDKGEKDKDSQHAQDILNNPTSTYLEQLDALDTLIKNGVIG